MKKRILKTILILIIIILPLFSLIHILSAKGVAASVSSASNDTDLSAISELDSHSVADIEKNIENEIKKEQERLEKERLEKERLEKERLEKERLEKEKAQKAKQEQAKQEQAKANQDKQATKNQATEAKNEYKVCATETSPNPQNDQGSYRQRLKGTVIAGDSLMHGLNEYNILDSTYLVTKVSANLKHLKGNIDTIINLNPKNLVVHYGLNNMSTNDTEINNFVSVYESILKDLHQKLPDTKIVVSSVFNVSSKKATGAYKDIPHFNSKLNEMCQRNGFVYLDNSGLISGNSSYYEPDGIHVKKSFYTEKFLPNLTAKLGV